MAGRTVPALRAVEEVRRGERTAAGLVDEALQRIDEWDRRLGAFLATAHEGAREEVALRDEAIRGGLDPGPLAGLPVAVKDNLCTRDLPTTCASRILEGFRSPYDATAVARLRAAGAVVVGKTNLDEFGMGSSTEFSSFHPTRNPWDSSRVPGGSSGGAAAAVAAGMAAAALGTDTGGSVRQPGAFCGLYALKPTYGRVSRYGLVAFASSLDQVGVLARDPETLRAVYEAVAGTDPRDATSRGWEDAPPGEGVDGLRVGVAESLVGWEGVETAVAGAVMTAAERLAAAGAVRAEASLPDPAAGVCAYHLVADAEASSNLARYDGVRYGRRREGETLEEMYRRSRGEGFGAEVKRRIMLGTYALSTGYRDAYYARARAARVHFRALLDRVFADTDLVLLPTSPTTAFPLGEKTRDPLAMYLADVFTVLANLTGLPALNVPGGLDARGLPVGVQLLAPAGREDLLLRAAAVLDAADPGPPAWPEPPQEMWA